jgi:DNA-binding winged helix-turn-helix (wHTH) protein
MPDAAPRIYRFGQYEADAAAGELRKRGVKLRLQEQPFQILVALLERPGQVVTREDLVKRLWPDGTFVDFDHSLNTAIAKLRDALDDSASNPRFVETLAKRGYRFIAPIASGDTGGGATAPAADTDLPRAPRLVARGLLVLIQVMYLAFYVLAMTGLSDIAARSAQVFPGWGTPVSVLAAVAAMTGMPVRIYLLAALGFDYHRLGEQFRRLFPVVLALDLLWGLSPFLVIPEIGLGFALAAVAGLLFLPFSQRTLMRVAYR